MSGTGVMVVWADARVRGRPIRTRAERMLGCRRVCEARDPATTSHRLRELAGDDIRPVRYWVAVNVHTPRDALERLARDEAETKIDWSVASAAVSGWCLVALAGMRPRPLAAPDGGRRRYEHGTRSNVIAYSVSRGSLGPKTFSARSTSARTANGVSPMGSSPMAAKIASNGGPS
jgi:hypothetical protein